jgi:hypothetical protein
VPLRERMEQAIELHRKLFQWSWRRRPGKRADMISIPPVNSTAGIMLRSTDYPLGYIDARKPGITNAITSFSGFSRNTKIRLIP